MRQALELALESLLHAYHEDEAHPKTLEAISAIKEALAQTQEPVAWWIPKAEQFCLPSSDGTRPFAKAWEPLYTTPPQRKPLTDEEIMNIAKVSCIGISPHQDTLNFAKVIEAAHGIKE